MNEDKNNNNNIGERLKESTDLLTPEDKYLPDGINGVKRSMANFTKYHTAAMAAADATDSSSTTYFKDDIKYKMTGKQLLLAIVLAMVLAVVFRLVPYGAELVFPDFTENPQYSFDVTDNVGSNLEYLQSLGIDTAVAAVDEPITFTYRRGTGPANAILGNNRIIIYSRPYGNNTELKHGDEITCDFRSYPAPSSNDLTGGSFRYVTMTVNGQSVSGYIDEDQLLQLYKTALKRNGLKSQFREATDRLFTSSSLRKELTKADSLIFQMGLYRPYGYPYHADDLALVCNYLSIFSVLIVLLCFTGVNLIRKKRANDAYMKQWNEESKRRWDEKNLSDQ